MQSGGSAERHVDYLEDQIYEAERGVVEWRMHEESRSAYCFVVPDLLQLWPYRCVRPKFKSS